MGTGTIKLDGAAYIGDEKVAELPIKLTKFQFLPITANVEMPEPYKFEGALGQNGEHYRRTVPKG